MIKYNIGCINPENNISLIFESILSPLFLEVGLMAGAIAVLKKSVIRRRSFNVLASV